MDMKVKERSVRIQYFCLCFRDKVTESERSDLAQVTQPHLCALSNYHTILLLSVLGFKKSPGLLRGQVCPTMCRPTARGH